MISFLYLNHRGEMTRRSVTPHSIQFIPNAGYDYPPGWFLTGYDHNKKAIRSFALSNIQIPDTAVNLFTLLELPR